MLIQRAVERREELLHRIVTLSVCVQTVWLFVDERVLDGPQLKHQQTLKGFFNSNQFLALQTGLHRIKLYVFYIYKYIYLIHTIFYISAINDLHHDT